MRVFYVDDFFSLGYNMFLYHVLVTWWRHSQPLQVKERQSSGWFKCPTASKSASPLCSNCCPIVLYYLWKKKTICLLSGSESEWPAVRGGLSKVSYGNHAFNLVHMIGSFVLIQFFFLCLWLPTKREKPYATIRRINQSRWLKMMPV